MTAPVGAADPPGARRWWRAIEPVHAVTYFTPEARQALRETGLRGFWMSYFASRSAPLGAVGPSTVIASFFNFHPSMVRRSIPDAWTHADPAAVLSARRAGAAAALLRLDTSIRDRAGHLARVLTGVVEAADGAGRVLFSANRELPPADDPVEALWQACTSLREHRGDGHVAALTAAGLGGCEALVLFARAEGLPSAVFLESRGWSADEWEAARDRLEDRALLQGDQLTPSGHELHRVLEETTDRLAALPFASLSPAEADDARRRLGEVAAAVTAGGDIPFPNPMGLPRPDRGGS